MSRATIRHGNLLRMRLRRIWTGPMETFSSSCLAPTKSSALIRELSHRAPSGIVILPLHGELPASEQDKAVARTGKRKIIVSTNVAETSLTIDGVTMVVDAGLARVARYDPHRGINTLLIEKISRASADQRSGRAGRTAPGLCLRLWTQRDHALRAAAELPEIKRLDLAETVLSLKAAGVRDLANFRWIDRPDEKSLARAEQLLSDLGALDSHNGEITSTGRRMLSFPVHPRYARMFLAAKEFDCVRAAALIAALTQSRNLLLRAERRIEEERAEIFGQGISDFLILIRAFSYAQRHDFRLDALRPLAIHAEAARQVKKLFEQFLEIARSEGLDTDAGAAKRRGHRPMCAGRFRRPGGSPAQRRNARLRCRPRPSWPACPSQCRSG